MGSRDVELRRLRRLVKAMESANIRARTTRRSGGLKGLGGDIITDKYLIEEKPDNLFTKYGRDTWEKIEDESIQRARRPVLIHGEFVTMLVSDWMAIVGDLPIGEEDDT